MAAFNFVAEPFGKLKGAAATNNNFSHGDGVMRFPNARNPLNPITYANNKQPPPMTTRYTSRNAKLMAVAGFQVGQNLNSSRAGESLGPSDASTPREIQVTGGTVSAARDSMTAETAGLPSLAGAAQRSSQRRASKEHHTPKTKDTKPPGKDGDLNRDISALTGVAYPSGLNRTTI